jgi:PAS domain S-box-containing protein
VTERRARTAPLSLPRLAWLPILLYFTATVLILVLDPPTVFDPPGLFAALNLIFRLGVGLAFAYVAGRTYVATGALPTLLLGTGMLLMGIGTTLATHLTGFVGPGAGVAVHAVSVLGMGTWLLAASAVTIFAASRRLPGSPRQHIGAAYGSALASLALLAAAITGGHLPPFFVPDAGLTVVARLLYVVTILESSIAALLFWQAHVFTRLPFFRWYAAGLLCFAGGLGVLLAQAHYGNLVTWMGRAGQFLGGAYLFAALVQSVRVAGHPGVGSRGLVMAFLQAHLPYRPLVESTAEAVLALDAAGRVLYWNDAARRLFGHDAVEAFGREVLDLLVPGEARAAVRALLEREGTAEIPLVHREGQPVAAEVSVYRDRTGRGVHTVWVARDIGERKRADAALRQAKEELEARVAERTAALRRSVQRLELAQVAAGLGIHDYDVRHGTIRWDDRVRALWGVGPDEEIPYAVFLAGLHPHDRAATEAAVDRALDPGGDGRYTAEYRVISRADGTERWIAATGQAFFEGGRAVRLVGTVQDITERKRVEEERRSVALFPEQNPDPVLRIAQATGKLLYANPASAPLLERWRVRVGESLGPAERRALLDPRRRGHPGELLVPCGERIYSLVSFPIPAAGYVNVYGRDVAERECTLAQLQESLAQERQAVADNRALLREVHHRVKNNLQMLCDLIYLQMETLSDPDQHQALQDAYTRIYAIARLHEHLHQSMRSGLVILRDYLGQLATGFGDLYPRIAVRIEVPPEPIQLDMDRAIHVGLIANELITNAAKHAFTDGQPGEVVVRLQSVGDGVELRVSDNGKGLPEGFDPSRATSLGLRIVNILAQRLKATVTTKNNGGTSFALTFPLEAEMPVEPTEA